MVLGETLLVAYLAFTTLKVGVGTFLYTQYGCGTKLDIDDDDDAEGAEERTEKGTAKGEEGGAEERTEKGTAKGEEGGTEGGGEGAAEEPRGSWEDAKEQDTARGLPSAKCAEGARAAGMMAKTAAQSQHGGDGLYEL